MITVETPPLKSWSFSTLVEFEKCPYKVFLSKVKKVPQPVRDEDHPLVRGNRIHKEAEDFIKGLTDGIPKSLQKYDKKFPEQLDDLRVAYSEQRVLVEDEWGFDNKFQVTGYWDNNIWCRVKLDAIEEIDVENAIITDWKTGKSMGNEVKHTSQGQLYACAAFMRYPQLQFLDVFFGYLDEGKQLKRSYQRDSKFTRYLSRFIERGQRMTSAVVFQAKPNAHNCAWCDYGPTRGNGQCIYGATCE